MSKTEQSSGPDAESARIRIHLARMFAKLKAWIDQRQAAEPQSGSVQAEPQRDENDTSRGGSL